MLRPLSNMEVKEVFGVVIWMLIFWIALSYLPDLMTFVEINNGPSESPPWYFILTDLRASIAGGIGVFLSMLLIFFYYSKTDKHFNLLIYFSFIFYGAYIGDGLVILLNTTNVFNANMAETNWETFDQYLNNPWKSYVIYVMLMIVTAIYIVMEKKVKRN